MMWARAFKSQTSEGIFLNGTEKTEIIDQFAGRVEQ